MSHINHSLEYVIDQYLHANEFNYTIVANIFHEEDAPTMLGYKNMNNDEQITTAIVNADQDKLTLFFVNHINYKLIDKERQLIPYEDIIRAKKTKTNLGIRTKMTIQTKDETIVLDYGPTFIGYKEYTENKNAFQKLMKEKFNY